MTTPWKESEAKKLLKEDILSGVVTPEMKPKDVYEMRPEYKLYPLKRFAPNLKNLRESIEKEKKKGPKVVPWQDSMAKKLLEKDIDEGKVTSNMLPSEVYEMHPEYKQYDKKNFGSNLRNLRKSIGKEKERAAFDRAAFLHDRRIHPPAAVTSRGYPRWCGSAAERLLIEDIDNGRHEGIRPERLYRSKSEYQAFPLNVFRDHIYQETRDRKTRAYWLNRKKQEENK